MFNIKRNRKGEVLLDINLNLLDTLISFFIYLNKLFSSKIFYLIPMGLGIGFGMGVVVFSQPAKIGAQEMSRQTLDQIIVPQRITLPEINFTSSIKNQSNFSLLPIHWQENLVYFSSFGIEKSTSPLIASKINIIENLKLGNKIIVEGKNNGQYKYAVTQIKQLPAKDFYQALEDVDQKIIIISPANFLGTELLMALGK